MTTASTLTPVHIPQELNVRGMNKTDGIGTLPEQATDPSQGSGMLADSKKLVE